MSKNKDIYSKIKQFVFVDDFNNSVNKGLLAKLYDVYDNNKVEQIDFTTICDTQEELSLVTKLLVNKNTSDDYNRITDEVMQSFNLEKMQKRKNELVNLCKTTTDKELINKYQSELREIIMQSAKK